MIGAERTGAARLEEALRGPALSNRLALVPFLTAGFPDLAGFPALVEQVATVSDAMEIGVPFSDPIADGVTIQRASRAALRQGVTLRWVMGALRESAPGTGVPIVLMSYLNPLLAYGFDALARDAVAARIDGFVVPDLPLEESGPLGAALDAAGLALVQIVTPATPRERLRCLCEASRGFVYAVTVTGTTGGRIKPGHDLLAYLDSVRAVSTLPVLAGFGIRGPEQAELLRGHADGVIVGSAVVDLLEQGRDPISFLRGFRAGSVAAERNP